MLRNVVFVCILSFDLCVADRLTGRDVSLQNNEVRSQMKRLNKDDAKALITYNIALNPTVSEFNERRSALPSFVVDLDADLVCLQEVWYMKDARTIIDLTRDRFPYSYTFHHTGVSSIDEDHANTPPCTYQAGAALLQCMGQHCVGLETSELYRCVVEKCRFLELDQNCISCIVFSGGVTAHMKGCLSPDYSINTAGLLILSKEEPLEVGSGLYYPGQKHILPRGFLKATFYDLNNVVCTHLTARFKSVPYFEPLPFSSFQEQHEAEVLKLIDMAKNKNMILIGDLNTGPDLTEKTTGEFPENYALLVANGFKDPIKPENQDCTWCSDNPLVNSTYSHVLDHVLTHGSMRGFDGKQLFKDDLPGKDFPMSDHYAVEVKVYMEESWGAYFLRKACVFFGLCSN